MKGLRIFSICGIIFTIAIGTLLHFAYDFSGQNCIVGIFAPINESIWEHLKVLFFPASIWLIAGFLKLNVDKQCYLFSGITSLISGLVIIPILYYTYTYFTIENYMWADLTIYGIAVIMVFGLLYYLTKNYNFKMSLKTAVLIWDIIFALFVIFTLIPPDLELFREL